MKPFVRSVTVLALGVALSVAWAQTTSPTDWIRANAIPLTTAEAGHGFDDMQPLKKVIGNARIVSLGEATHGTREFFQLKHRMLEFLASEMGFTIFSIEASMPEAFRLNDYVLEGKGDPAKLLKGMYFWTWDTEEVLDMILWMREFNASGKGRVEFTGFDMQTPTVALQNAGRFVVRYEMTYSGTMQELSSSVLRVSASLHEASPSATSPPADAATLADGRTVIARVQDAMAHLEAGRADYRTAGATDYDIDWAIQNLRIARQSLQNLTNDVGRDRSMADNVKWILDHRPNAKIVLWAHNLHVAAGGGMMSEMMGEALRGMFGKEMVVFGFAFNQGSFRAVPTNGPLKNFTVPPLPPDSLDATLASASIPMFAIDLRQAPAWFQTPRVSREIGSVYPAGGPDANANLMSFIAPAAFDAMLFVEKTTAALKNPR
jgi:erythromycin esterase